MEEQQSKNKVEELLEENLKLNKEIYEICQRVKKYMFIAQLYSIIQIMLIAISIALAIIFLLPLFSQVSPYLKDLPMLFKSSTIDVQSLLK